jgi:hypothetical protein
MGDVTTGLADTDIATEWRHEKASQMADDDATDPQDQSDGTDDADGTDSDGDSGDSDADGTDS